MYFNLIERLTGLCCLLFLFSCAADDDPAPSCSDAGMYEIPPVAQVITTAIESDTSNAIFWVCAGGELTLSGTLNTVLVSAEGMLTLNGNENTAYILGEGEVMVYGNEQTLWLNGDSKSTIRGNSNLLNYYKTGMLNLYGEFNQVEDICGNVEVDFTKAPEEGCQ